MPVGFTTDFGILKPIPSVDDQKRLEDGSQKPYAGTYTNVVGETGVGVCTVTTWYLARDEQRKLTEEFSGKELNEALKKSGARLQNRVVDGEGIFPADEMRVDGVLRQFRFINNNGVEESPAFGIPSVVTTDETDGQKDILVFFLKDKVLVDPAIGIPAYMKFDSNSGTLIDAKYADGFVPQEKLDALKGIVKMPNMIEPRYPVFNNLPPLPKETAENGKTAAQMAEEAGHKDFAEQLRALPSAPATPASLTPSFTESSRKTGKFMRGFTRFWNADTPEKKREWATQDLNAEMTSKTPDAHSMRLHIEAGARVTVGTLEFAAVRGFERVVDHCLVRLDHFGDAALLAKAKGHDGIADHINAVAEERRALGIDDTMLRMMKENPAQAQKLEADVLSVRIEALEAGANPLALKK